MKRITVVFGVGLAPSGLSEIGEDLVKTAVRVSTNQKSDLLVFTGRDMRREKSEALLMEEYAKSLALTAPTVREEGDASQWKTVLAVVRLLPKTFPGESFVITFVSHPLQMRSIRASFEAVPLLLKDEVAFIASPFPILERYDNLLSRKEFHSAESLRRHERFSYFVHRLFSFPHPECSLFRVLSSMRIRI